MVERRVSQQENNLHKTHSLGEFCLLNAIYSLMIPNFISATQIPPLTCSPVCPTPSTPNVQVFPSFKLRHTDASRPALVLSFTFHYKTHFPPISLRCLFKGLFSGRSSWPLLKMTHHTQTQIYLFISVTRITTQYTICFIYLVDIVCITLLVYKDHEGRVFWLVFLVLLLLCCYYC